MTDDNVLSPGTAPTACSAGEIRAGCPAGRTVVVRVEESATHERADWDADMTTRDEATLELPLGVEACLRHVVREGAETTTFWFSTRRPGMPVKVTSQRGDHVLVTTVMVSDVVDGTQPG